MRRQRASRHRSQYAASWLCSQSDVERRRFSPSHLNLGEIPDVASLANLHDVPSLGRVDHHPVLTLRARPRLAVDRDLRVGGLKMDLERAVTGALRTTGWRCAFGPIGWRHRWTRSR